jgi:hypothetical protein
MGKKHAQRKETPMTDAMELKLLETEFDRTERALRAKRRALVPEEEREREAFVEAFELGDDLDDERAIRATALLLDWASDDGMQPANGLLTLGLSKVLYRAADDMAKKQRRRERHSND